MEMDKYFEELNDMANFKGFGEKPETEEIIIDGVDVAGCCYYEQKNDKGEWCDLTCTRENAPAFRCESIPNCYYKQLQRLQQENRVLQAYKDVNEDFKKAWEELKAENERLNKLTGIFSARLCKKYKQTLQEIKEIINQSCDKCKYGKDGIHCKIGDCGDGKVRQILQKISEVE